MYDTLVALPEAAKFFVALLVIVTVFIHLKYDHIYLTYGPIVLTVIGILGCFVGITLGLLHFDTNNIQQSVPNLLSEIKTSFLASVFGIIGALTINSVSTD